MIKLKNLLAENMRRFGTKNLNENNSSYAWPKWKADMSTSFALKKATGDPINEVPSWFVAAADCFKDLETKLQENGWQSDTLPADRVTKEQWSQTGEGGAMKKEISKIDDESGTFKNAWSTNVEPNLKESFWTSPDGNSSIHISTWESFDDWKNSSTEPTAGINMRKCGAGEFKHCSAKPIVWGGGELNV